MSIIKSTDVLKSIKDSDINNSVQTIEKVKLLTTGLSIEEEAVLRRMGLASEIDKAQNLTACKIEIESLDNEFSGNIYSLKHIEKLAFKYGLELKKTRDTKCTLSKELISEIMILKKKHNLSEYDFRDNFFILAPSSYFKKPNHQKPLVLFKTSNRSTEGGYYFKVLSNSEMNFGIERILIGKINKTSLSKVMYSIQLYLILCLSVLYFFHTGGVILTIVFITILGIPIMGAAGVISKFIEKNTEDKWKNNCKYI